MKQIFLNSARKSNRFFLCLIFALWGLTAQTHAQVTRYVSANGTNNNPATATSWAASTTNLQGAINASASGDQVWVAGGIYKPTASTGPASRTISFAMKSGVSLYGGFTGDETSLTGRVLTYPSSTTLSGDIDNDGTLANNSYHVIATEVNLGGATSLDGFVITGGNANFSSFRDIRGGGIYGCVPRIYNCSFENNFSGYAGGAIYSSHVGGANNCILTIGNSSFRQNAAATFGGAIYIDNVNMSSIPQPQLTNCSFLSNSANSGGALYNDVFQGSCSPELTNCSFQNNFSHPLGQGGALFTGPSANNSKPILTNCVLWNNGGANSISVPFTAPASASYSLFDASVTGYTNVTGNVTVTASPFTASTSNELIASSPAINAGLNSASLLTGITTDIVGRPRIVGARVDMGAYESQVVPANTSVTASASAICSGSLLSLTATASAPGITPVDYNWSSQPAGFGGTGIGPTPTFAMPIVTTATTYTITVLIVDISQLPIATASTTVTVNPSPAASLINSGPVPCSGEAVTLTASGGSTYQFSDGATPIGGSSASVSAGGIYSVTATGVGGCTATASTTVGNATPMQVFITPANVTLCNGQSVILTPYRGQLSRRAVPTESIAGARLAAGEFAYQWSTGETTESISATAAGTYSVTVTDGQGCKAIASTPVTVRPVASLTLTTSANLTALCPGQLISVSAIGCAGGTANWSTGETGRSIVVNPFSTTTLWANCLLNECTGPASNTLTLAVRAIPTVLSNLSAICSGGAAVLSVSTCTGGSVRWSSGQIGASVTVRPTVTTSYSASCVFGSCTLASGNSVTVAIRSLPDTPLLTLTANTVCTGQALPISYAGCVGGTLLKYDILQPNGTQASWAICRNGCDSPTSNTLVYTVLTAPTTPTITADQTAICAGNSVLLSATGCNGTVRWTTGTTGVSIQVWPTARTTYRATCATSNCTSTSSNAITVNILPVATISIRVTSASICAGASTVLTAVGCTSGVIAWSTGQQGQSFTVSPAQSITYSARCTLATGCTAVSNELAVTVKLVPGAPVITASTSAVCSVGYPVLSTTSCAEGIVRWSNNLTGPIVSFLVRTPNTYWATCTQTGCASPVSNSVTIGVLTPPAAPTITAVGNPHLCQGYSVYLRADGCVGIGETVRWSTGETGTILLATPLSTTTYQATCTRNGCVSLPSASFQVFVGTAPVVAIVGQTSLCAGSSTTLRASGCPSSGTVTWSTGSAIAQGVSLIVSPTQSTTYLIQCKTIGMCTAESNPFVIQVSTPDIPQITASTTALCQGGGIVSLTATGCGKGTVYWSNGQVGPIQTLNVRATSGFYATCKLPNGCTSPRSNSVLVSVQSLAVTPTSINIGSSRTFSLTVSGCVGGTIYWNGAFTGGTPNSLTTAGSATAYPVSFSTGPLTTGPIALSALATISASCRLGPCFDLTRNISVSWVSVLARVAITTENADLLLRVAPVPFTNELMVWLPDSNAPATVSLLDLAGRAQLTKYVEAETGALQLTTASLPSGIYLVEVWQNQRRYVKKIVK